MPFDFTDAVRAEVILRLIVMKLLGVVFRSCSKLPHPDPSFGVLC